MKSIICTLFVLVISSCATAQVPKQEESKSEPEIDVNLLVNCVYQKEQDLGMCFLPPYDARIAEKAIDKTVEKITKFCNSKDFMRTKLIHNESFGHHLYFQCSLIEESKENKEQRL